MSLTAAAPPARRRRIRIGSLWIDQMTFAEAVEAVEQLVDAGRGGAVFTPNTDHLVNAEADPGLREAYASADLSLVDGMPVVWASRLLGTPLPERISGADLTPVLLSRAAERHFRVYLLGAPPGVAEKAAERLRARGVVVAGAAAPFIGLAARPDEDEVIEQVRAARPDLVLVALGSPKQERFIHRCGPRLAPAVSIAVGATLEFIAGTVSRAPRWMSRAGLEWLFRLWQEPRRLARRYLLNDPRFALIVWRSLRTPRETRLSFQEGGTAMTKEQDRRRFPRLKAPVLCRPTGQRLSNNGQALDISLGGARVYTDDETAKGTPLELELVFPDGSSAVCRAEVVWVVPLPPGAPARFDVGLRFTELPESAMAQLAQVLSAEED